MVSKKDKEGYWCNLEHRGHKFSGPYIIFFDGDVIYCQYNYWHRLYGFAWDWRGNLNWYVNNKSLKDFKGAKNDF